MVGANGSGKSSLFEFLKFLRDGVYQEIPSEIVFGTIGQQIFHIPGPESFWWDLEIDNGFKIPISYQGELMGPVGRPHVAFERVISSQPLGNAHTNPFVFMNIRERQGVIQDPESKKLKKQDISLTRQNQLALSTINNPNMTTLYNLREYMQGWRFYSSFKIDNDKIRKPVPIEMEPVLYENAGNLSAVLFHLMTEHREAFDELQHHLRSAIPGFKGLTIKAYGGRGEVIAFWQEEGRIEPQLTLADLSDGILRFICWAVLCLQPNPPSLICIDEPDQGLHPRTLPILAGLFEKASERTQILLATHASYFLLQFEMKDIAVLRKKAGDVEFVKPTNSKILTANLDDFGNDEIELMHRNDELEWLS